MRIIFNVSNDTTKKKEILDRVRLDLFFLAHLFFDSIFLLFNPLIPDSLVIRFQIFLKCKNPICRLVVYNASFKFCKWSNWVTKNTLQLFRCV